MAFAMKVFLYPKINRNNPGLILQLRLGRTHVNVEIYHFEKANEAMIGIKNQKI